jgi:hypothetical protein
MMGGVGWGGVGWGGGGGRGRCARMHGRSPQICIYWTLSPESPAADTTTAYQAPLGQRQKKNNNNKIANTIVLVLKNIYIRLH